MSLVSVSSAVYMDLSWDEILAVHEQWSSVSWVDLMEEAEAAEASDGQQPLSSGADVVEDAKDALASYDVMPAPGWDHVDLDVSSSFTEGGAVNPLDVPLPSSDEEDAPPAAPAASKKKKKRTVPAPITVTSPAPITVTSPSPRSSAPKSAGAVAGPSPPKQRQPAPNAYQGDKRGPWNNQGPYENRPFTEGRQWWTPMKPPVKHHNFDSGSLGVGRNSRGSQRRQETMRTPAEPAFYPRQHHPAPNAYRGDRRGPFNNQGAYENRPFAEGRQWWTSMKPPGKHHTFGSSSLGVDKNGHGFQKRQETMRTPAEPAFYPRRHRPTRKGYEMDGYSPLNCPRSAPLVPAAPTAATFEFKLPLTFESLFECRPFLQAPFPKRQDTWRKPPAAVTCKPSGPPYIWPYPLSAPLTTQP